MASLKVQISGSSVVNGAKEYTISNAHIQMIIDMMIAKYSPKDADGNITTPLTPGQALATWVDRYLVRPTKVAVRNHNREAQINALVTPEPDFAT
jgi:hypothetical protein